MAAYEILVSHYQVIGYDLQEEIDKYAAALEAHKSTIDVPAPVTTALVETIVRRHDGAWVIVPVPEMPPPTPLPKDPKYYRTPAEQTSMLAKEAEEQELATMQKKQREEMLAARRQRK
jgi:hypothetical protein